jgi:hypothetical protein
LDSRAIKIILLLIISCLFVESKKRNMKKVIKLLILICLLGACKMNPITTNTSELNYPKTILPEDVTKLWVEDGNSKSDTVLIICQGGPSQELTFVENGKTSYRYIPNYSSYQIAYLHQAQTLNKEIFNYKTEFTLEMAEKEVNNTSEILYRTVKYFKSQGKIVIVIGTSYGAYIIPNYLATRTSLADKYVEVF